MPSTALTLTINASGYVNSFFTNPGNALVSNNSYATVVTTSTSSRRLTADTNAASVIPSNAIIIGVVCTCEYKASVLTYSPYLYFGPGGSSGLYSGGKGPASVTTADVVYTTGSTTDQNTGTTIAALATMTVLLGTNSSGSTTHSIDNMTMTVYWDYPASINPLLLGELF